MPSFSAVLLAGGKSSRMGRDKALLPLPGTELLLWQRQLRVLEELRPGKIFWSGSPRPGLPAHLIPVTDGVAQAGPLAGITAALDLLTDDLLVVLAVDLPCVTADFFRTLLAECAANHGAVAQHDGLVEPLAAIYPRRLAPLAQSHLAAGRYALRELIDEAVRQDLLQLLPLAHSELFLNLNAPGDLSGLSLPK